MSQEKINELQEQNKKLQEEYALQVSTIQEMCETIERLEKENLELLNKVQALEAEGQKLKADSKFWYDRYDLKSKEVETFKMLASSLKFILEKI